MTSPAPGTGMTMEATSIHPSVEELTLAEIEPKVVGAARTCPGFLVNFTTRGHPIQPLTLKLSNCPRGAMFRSGASALPGDNEYSRRAFPADERIRRYQKKEKGGICHAEKPQRKRHDCSALLIGLQALSR